MTQYKTRSKKIKNEESSNDDIAVVSIKKHGKKIKEIELKNTDIEKIRTLSKTAQNLLNNINQTHQSILKNKSVVDSIAASLYQSSS
ncbi:MAG: hypothetical protein K8Q89_03365 [Nitrosarchaeum sp.]|nr:hypothetical protein [Nitrosarchaeum sp.]